MSEEPREHTAKPGVREILTDAIRFWEWRRLFYNLALAAVVLLDFSRHFPLSKRALEFHALLTLFLLAVLANAAYCAAYLVELLVQFSEFREPWRRYRVALWLIGTAFAAVLAHFFAIGMFGAETLPQPF